MRKGFTAFSANNDVDPVVKAKAPAPESLMNWRREVFTGQPSRHSSPKASLGRSESRRGANTQKKIKKALKTGCEGSRSA